MEWIITIIQWLVYGLLFVGAFMMLNVWAEFYIARTEQNLFNREYWRGMGLFLTGFMWDGVYYFLTGNLVVSSIYKWFHQLLIPTT